VPATPVTGVNGLQMHHPRIHTPHTPPPRAHTPTRPSLTANTPAGAARAGVPRAAQSARRLRGGLRRARARRGAAAAARPRGGRADGALPQARARAGAGGAGSQACRGGLQQHAAGARVVALSWWRAARAYTCVCVCVCVCLVPVGGKGGRCSGRVPQHTQTHACIHAPPRPPPPHTHTHSHTHTHTRVNAQAVKLLAEFWAVAPEDYDAQYGANAVSVRLAGDVVVLLAELLPKVGGRGVGLRCVRPCVCVSGVCRGVSVRRHALHPCSCPAARYLAQGPSRTVCGRQHGCRTPHVCRCALCRRL
jgi:hypothetical protein